MEPTDPEETPEVTGLPKLRDRVDNFLAMLQGHQDLMRGVAAKVDQNKTHELGSATKIRLTGDLKKMSTEAVGKIIRDLGKPLHDEIQQTKALTEEVRQKLLYQIIEADAGFKSTTKELGVYKKGYTPKTAFTPANTKWKGKAVKSGKKFTTDFRTDREKSLFNALVAQGAGPGYKIGRGGLVHSISLTDIGELASLSEEYTTVVPLGGRNVPFFAFSKGKPDHVKDGGSYVTPQLYIAAANQRLGEAVRAAYPETGEFQKAAIGWDYKLNRGKKKAKTYKAKVIPGVSNTLAPYDDSETINGELVIRGVFTNNPAVTRAQLAAGWTVRVPTTFEGKLNPSIVEENGIVVSTYMPGDFGLDNPILPGANIPMSRKYSPANRVSGPDSRAATAEYLFQSQFDDPSSDRYFQAQAKGLKKNAENILFGNKKSDPANRNRNLPFSEEYIEEVVQETTSKFVTLFNEYRLAQFVTKHLVASVRRQIESGRLNAPKLEAYAEGTGGSFSDLDVGLKVKEDIIREVGAADVTANAALTAVVPLIQKHFGGLPLDIIADQLSLIYPDTLGGGEPASVILAYAKLLFAGTTSLTGKFRTLPTGNLNQSNPVLQRSFKRSAGKYAQREKVQNRSSISTVPFPDSGDISGPYDQTPEARAENLYNDIGTETGNILDELLAFQKDPDGQMLHADFVEASEQTAVQPSLGDDLLTHSHSMRVVSELYSAMKIPAVEEAFSALAKTMGRRLNIQGLGDLRGEQLLDILSGTMHDNFEFREGVDLLVALRAGKIPEGQRVASLLIANGWLPPTTVPQNIGRDVEIPISTPSEAKPFFNAPAAESTDSPEVAVEKGEDASRAKAVQEGIDIEQRDMGIDPTDYALIEDASDRERYRRLYMEAASNMQADLMDITAEQNKTVTSIESALIELNELQEDLNVFGTGTQLDGTRPANTGESRPIKRMLEVKTSRITEIKDKSDALKQEAARIDELVASERIEGLEPYIQRLDTLVNKPHKTRRNPESFAKFYGVSDDIAKLYANTEGRDQRKAIASRRRDQLNEQRLRMLTELPQHAGRLRAEASVKDDHALRLTEQATALAEANPAQEIYSLMSRWAKAKQRLEDLKGEYAELKPAAQNLIKGEVSRLGKFYNQSSADQLWDQLTALAQTHPDSGGPRPKYAGLTSKAMELLAESDRKKFNQKEYDRNQKVLITKLRGVTSSVELSGIGEMNHKPTILWSGNPDIGSIPGVDTDESGNIIPTMQSPSLPMKRVRKRAKNGRFASLSAIDPALRDAAHASNTAEMATLGLKSGDSESMINALQVLKKSGPPHLRLVADVLLSGVGDFVRTVNLSVVEMDNGFAGLYDAKSNTITLNLNEHNGRGLGDVLVHELLHGATVNVLSNPTTPAQIAASRRITQLRQLAANLAGKRGAVSPAVMHGLQSDAEFISYALTAPEFQTILKGLALPGQRSVWSRVVDSVLQFFGLDPKKFRNQRSAVDELLDFARMGMTSRRTFTTDARWDMHNADRVDAAEDKFNYHASRIETENSGVYGSRARYQSRIEESPRSDGSVQFTIYFDDKVVGGRVADTAAEAAEVREALNEEIFGEATQEDIDNLTQGFTEGDQTGGDAGDTTLFQEEAEGIMQDLGGNISKLDDTTEDFLSSSFAYSIASKGWVLSEGNLEMVPPRVSRFVAVDEDLVVDNVPAYSQISEQVERALGFRAHPSEFAPSRVNTGRPNNSLAYWVSIAIDSLELDATRSLDSLLPQGDKAPMSDEEAAASISGRVSSILGQASTADGSDIDTTDLNADIAARQIAKANLVEAAQKLTELGIPSTAESLTKSLSGLSPSFSRLRDARGWVSKQYAEKGDKAFPHDQQVHIPQLIVMQPDGRVMSELDLVPNRGGDAGDTRNALPSPGTGDATIDPEAALESMMPEGMVIEFHDTQAGVMGTRRAEPSIVRVNRVHLQEMVRGLPPTHAEGVIRATLDEELAELSADSVMSENDYVSLAVNMSESDRTQLEHSYYGAMRLDYAETVARIQADRESGAWTDADLGREWFRQQTTRLAFGETREDTIDRLLDLGDTDPGMFTRVVDAIAHYIDILKGRLAEAFSSGTAAKISIVSRNLRALRNEGVLPSPEPAPSGELGDSTAFLNALDNSIINGQEDRTRFALPVYGNKSKMDNIWTKARSTFYDMGHPELQMVLDVLNGTNKAVEYDMKQFHKRFPAMQKRALEAGFSLEDIMLVFGTTAPMVVEADRKVIRKQLKAFKATLRGKGLAWGEFQKKKDEKERELYDAAASRMASTFRKTQKAKENIFRDNGLGDVVDFMVEFRGRINKHKVQIGFDESNDVYLTRTYRYFKTPAYADAVKSGAVFTDPETGESIDFGALRTLASKEMFEKQVIKEAAKDNKRMSKDEIAQQTMVKLDEYLLTLDRRAKQNSTLDGVAMLRKDLNLLKTKKDIEAPLRALLGEVKDPFEVAVRTLHSVARFAANETFLQDFSETALKLGFASKEPAEGMELLFPSKLEDRFDALAGLYVKKDIANAIRDEFVPRGPALETSGQRAVNKVTRAASWLSGVSVFAKTSLGVGYWSRNMVSNGLLTTAQGLNPFNFSAMAEALKISRLANFDAGDNSTQEQRDHIRRLTELQIVRDDAQGRMTLDLMRGFAAGTQEQADAMLKLITEAQATGDMGKLKAAWAGSKIPTAASWLVESLANVNNWVDSMAKVNAYYQELNNIRDHYGDRKSETESEAYAAYKVKLTFPTHSQQLSVVKSFNRSPLGLAVLPFLRWKSEVLRTMFNTIPLAVAEIQAGETTRGVRRLVGFSATVAGGGKFVLSTAYMAANAVISSLADDEDGEDEETRDLTAEERADIRLGEPKWKREHDFVARLVGNQIQTVDLTYLLPHSMVTDIFAIASEGWQTDRPGTLNSLARYISGEVIGTNIAYTGLTETFGNEDDYGNPIALETDDVVTSTKKLMWHFYQATLEPSSFRKARAVTREGETKKFELIMGEVLGGRAVFLDRNEVAKKMFRSLKKTQDEAVQLRWSLTSGRAMPLEDVAPTIDKFNSAVAKNQYRLHQAITTLEGLGMSPREIQAVATSKSVRYSKQKIRDASLGIGRSWNPNKGWFNTAYSNMSDSEEVSDPMARINEVRRVISEGPGSYVVSVEGME